MIAGVDDLLFHLGLVFKAFRRQGGGEREDAGAHQALAVECRPHTPVVQTDRIFRHHHAATDMEMVAVRLRDLADVNFALVLPWPREIGVRKALEQRQGLELQFV